MPVSTPQPSPGRSTHHRRSRSRQLWLPACILLAATCPIFAQVLAKPGWKATGLTAESWWPHAIFYEVTAAPADVDFKAITVRLDALKSLGIDVLILPAPALPAPGSNVVMPNLDDLDNLLLQASSHGIRVLLTIQATPAASDLSGLARFWLNRGVAGLHIATPSGTSPGQTQAILQNVRKLTSGVLGERIIVSDAGLSTPDTATSEQSSRRSSRWAISSHGPQSSSGSGTQFQIDARASSSATLDAASLRALLSQTISRPNLLFDISAPSASSNSPDSRPPLAYAVGAIALIAHPAALIDSAANLTLEPTPERQEVAEETLKPPPPSPSPSSGTYLPYVPYVPPPKPQKLETPQAIAIPVDPLTLWYQKLAALHHDNATLRSGNKVFLDFDARNALVWVSRPTAGAGLKLPVFAICNLSSSPIQISLSAAVKSLDLHGLFLRTLLRADPGMGAQDLNSVNVPAFGVYVGELRR
jgi:alpha-glucosidase